MPCMACCRNAVPLAGSLQKTLVLLVVQLRLAASEASRHLVGTASKAQQGKSSNTGHKRPEKRAAC
jgi:hypothetical protein